MVTTNTAKAFAKPTHTVKDANVIPSVFTSRNAESSYTRDLNPAFTSRENATKPDDQFFNLIYTSDDCSTIDHHPYHTITPNTSTTTNPAKEFAYATDNTELNLAPVYHTVTPQSSTVRVASGQQAEEYNTLQHRISSKVKTEKSMESELNQPPVYHTLTPKTSSVNIPSGEQVEKIQKYCRMSSKVDNEAEYQVPNHGGKSTDALPMAHFYHTLIPPTITAERVDKKNAYSSLLHGVTSMAAIVGEYLVPQPSQKVVGSGDVLEPSVVGGTV